MTCQPLTFLVPGIGPAGLPLPPTALALPEPANPAHRPDANETGDALWKPDPGAIEFDSWTVYLRHLVR